jgi:ribonucleoside-diphosphate reductase beta chain
MLAGYDHLLAAARRLQWDAEAIDLSADRVGGDALITDLVAGFLVAESAVAQELDPWIAAAGDPAARECFAVQQRDERRHARFFERVADEVLGERPAARPEIVELFARTLPATARALAADTGTLGEAVGLYHLVIEGIVFAVGQEALLSLAVQRGLRGVADGVARVQADERWHVGLGVLQLQRLSVTIDVSDHAAAAMAVWGPDVATPERVEHSLAAHARRLKIAGVESAP